MQNKNTRIVSKTNTNHFQHRNDLAKSIEDANAKGIVPAIPKDAKPKFHSLDKPDRIK